MKKEYKEPIVDLIVFDAYLSTTTASTDDEGTGETGDD